MNARFLVSQSLLQVSNNHEYHSGQGMPWVLQVCAKTVSKRSKRFFANNGQNSYCCKSHRHVITRLHTHTLYLNKSFALLLWLSLSNHYECTRHQWEFGGCHSGKRSKRSAHAKWFAQRWQVGGMGTHQVSARLASLWKRQMVQDWRRNSHENYDSSQDSCSGCTRENGQGRECFCRARSFGESGGTYLYRQNCCFGQYLVADSVESQSQLRGSRCCEYSFQYAKVRLVVEFFLLGLLGCSVGVLFQHG